MQHPCQLVQVDVVHILLMDVFFNEFHIIILPGGCKQDPFQL